MSRSRTETWLLLIVVGIALIPVAIAELWGSSAASCDTPEAVAERIGLEPCRSCPK